jgi:hypothetical protein
MKQPVSLVGCVQVVINEPADREVPVSPTVRAPRANGANKLPPDTTAALVSQFCQWADANRVPAR